MQKVKIVVTGGPSGGKTTLIEALQKDLKGKVAVVPEAASILYRGGFPRRSTRWDENMFKERSATLKESLRI